MGTRESTAAFSLCVIFIWAELALRFVVPTMIGCFRCLMEGLEGLCDGSPAIAVGRERERRVKERGRA